MVLIELEERHVRFDLGHISSSLKEIQLTLIHSPSSRLIRSFKTRLAGYYQSIVTLKSSELEVQSPLYVGLRII
jgi:hypothetical protein